MVGPLYQIVHLAERWLFNYCNGESSWGYTVTAPGLISLVPAVE